MKLNIIAQIVLLENKIQYLNELGLDQLKSQYVGDGEGKISPEIFNDILKSSNGKSAYATWLTLRVIDKSVKVEDIYKYKEYFKIFDKYKNKYPLKDINQIKTKQQISDFNKITTDIADELASTGIENNEKGKNLVPLKGIEELKSVGINLLGVVDGYQCFKIPTELAGNKDAWKVYRKWLAKCGNRGEGEGIEICTMADYTHFKNYLSTDDLYVFFNTSDPKSPYQFHYKDEQFMDKNDTPLI
jgi:hypothetical protein